MKSLPDQVNRAAQMRADGRDGAKALILAKQENPQVRQEGWTLRIILRFQRLEPAVRLIQHVRHQKTPRRGERRAEREKRRAPAQGEGQEISALESVVRRRGHIKSEIRNPKSEASPKSETRRLASARLLERNRLGYGFFGFPSDFGFR